jgi:hypothetical protein
MTLTWYDRKNNSARTQLLTPNGPGVHDEELMDRRVYFPQEDPALNALMDDLLLVIAHEDYVHKCKRAASKCTHTHTLTHTHTRTHTYTI